MLKRLDTTTVEKPSRPVRILQFGEGNFLRAFVDWLIDAANNRGVIDMGVAICQPIIDPEQRVLSVIETLRGQDNMYHVYLEGIENRQPTKQIDIVKSVMDSFNPYTQYDRYMSYVLSADLRFIISNTTEAGIRYEAGDDIYAMPPLSFPAKILALLYRRYQHFAGDISKGLIILCCELIESNGTRLREYVIKHAQDNHLESEFLSWLDDACIFCDTLVDRIVPGFPSDTITQIKEEIGFDDNMVVKAEFYHLWAIGGVGYKRVQEELPLDKAALHVVYMESIKEFRDKKVRILNGSHTGMVSIALQMGCKTVMDAFNNPLIEQFVNEMVTKEVIPMIEEDRAELEHFTSSILERFYNPYIKHLLQSIALNSLSKWEARNYPTVKDNWEKAGVLARYETFTLAALLRLYSGKVDFEPNDTSSHIAFIKNGWDSTDMLSTVRSIISDSGIFTVDFAQVPGFVEEVAHQIEEIERCGMANALKNFLG